MTRVVPNTPFYAAITCLLLWTVSSVFVVIPVQLSSTLISITLVYIGSYISVFTKKEDQMKKDDAALFPLMASGALLSLYIAFKYFNETVVKELIFVYLLIVSGMAMAGVMNMVLEETLSEVVWSFALAKPIQLNVTVRKCDLVSYPIAFGFCLVYYFKGFWVGNNILGICITIFSLASESIGSFKTGCILLAGLFLYDIFWVFGTEVMVKVATGVKGPIKFVFPKALPAPTEYTREYFSMLGLGDVVVPGFFIAFLLSFDAYNARKEGVDTSASAQWRKPYFHTACVLYALSLVVTVVVMLYFKHAQPALLYIVPAMYIASFGTALCKKQVKELWNYSEEEVKTKYSKKNDWRVC